VGSDDLFRKRKARTSNELARKAARKSEYESILIVCEGTKTEPNYFKELIDDLELNTANVQTVSSPSTCPRKLVEFAIAKAEEEEHDFVYCVFDKDNHSKYHEAMQLIDGRPNIIAANSVPCFEYWIVLHYQNTTRAFYGSASKSPGDEVVEKLKQYIPGYSKGKRGTYAMLKGKKMDKAMINASKVNAAATAAGTDNPSTHIYKLVQVLLDIRSKMEE